MIHPGEQMGGRPAACKACHGCLFAHGPAPFEDAPDKVYCLIYPRDLGAMKPSDVLFDGAPCEHFRPEQPEGSSCLWEALWSNADPTGNR